MIYFDYIPLSQLDIRICRNSEVEDGLDESEDNFNHSAVDYKYISPCNLHFVNSDNETSEEAPQETIALLEERTYM